MIRHILRDEAFQEEHTEFYQFSHGTHIVWSRSEQTFRTLTLDSEALYAERLYTVAVQKYHYNNLKPFLDITLEEAAKGCAKKLEIERLVTCKTCHGTGARDGKEAFKSCPTCQGRGIITQQSGFFVQQSTCPTCHGTGEIISDPCPVCRGEGRVREDSHITIRIPAGVATGSQLRIAGEGDAGVHGGPTGDLHVFIDVKPHDIFQREGNDLSCTVPVPLSLAVSGGRLKVPTLEGAATIKLAGRNAERHDLPSARQGRAQCPQQCRQG